MRFRKQGASYEPKKPDSGLGRGLLGGMLSHYLSPQVVQAQSQVPKELRAGSFVLHYCP
jgi:hypothetical protein